MKKAYEKPTIKSEQFKTEMMQAVCEHNGSIVSATHVGSYYSSTCQCHEDSNTLS